MFSVLVVGWGDVVDWLADDGIRILVILVAAFVADFAVKRIVPRVLTAAITRQMANSTKEGIDQRVHTLDVVIGSTARSVIAMVALLTILPVAGVSIGPLLASVGIAGFAIGFGAQSLVKDVLGGLFILFENQYARGDVVAIAGITGTVQDIGIRRTVLRDLDGVVHYVPNGDIHVASNKTQEYSRVNFNVGVSYSEDIDRVMAVIGRVGEEMAADSKFSSLIITPPMALRVDNLGDSSVDIKIVGKTKANEQWIIAGELRKRLKLAFDEEGIEIPFPHRVIVTRGAKATDVPSSDS